MVSCELKCCYDPPLLSTKQRAKSSHTLVLCISLSIGVSVETVNFSSCKISVSVIAVVNWTDAWKL